MNDVLHSDLQYIKGVGPKLAKVLAKKGISTVEDALYFVPRAYEDRRHITPIANLVPGTQATVLAKVVRAHGHRMGRKMRFEVVVADATGSLLLNWFNAFPTLQDTFSVGSQFLIFGDVKSFRGLFQITHPEFEKIEDLVEGKPRASFHFGRIIPVYSEPEGVQQKTLRKMMGEVLKTSLPALDESLPDNLRTRLGLPTLRKSFASVHFPAQTGQGNSPAEAMRRIIFEEFFILQLGLGLKKETRKKEVAPKMVDTTSSVEAFRKVLPFQLTQDQEKAIHAVLKDLAKPEAMVHLVQGDVGSGKTVVGFAAAVVAAQAGFQTAFMAPTELLAQQHAATAEKFLKPLGIQVALLTHSTSSLKDLQNAVRNGAAQLIIGTHALFQEKIQFKNLGLVIVDEQHRFGVEQRTELLKKALKHVPHLLMMTATPIPRTLALTLYGDLEMSIIREKPANRIPIRTRITNDRNRPWLYTRIRERVQKGEQVYIIYPLVEKSEKLELKSATEMFEKISKEVFPEFSVALLHGRMKAEEKDATLIQFKEKKFQILVATTVIEVGIDVPNATLMVIEHPERLGLSQLHQLRGRVGRGSLQSECLLVADKFVTNRLKIMESSDDGFVIAEEDLKIRGPGEFLGTRQSGLPGFRVGNILRDADLLQLAKNEADSLLHEDPELKLPENARIRQHVESRWKDKIERLKRG